MGQTKYVNIQPASGDRSEAGQGIHVYTSRFLLRTINQLGTRWSPIPYSKCNQSKLERSRAPSRKCRHHQFRLKSKKTGNKVKNVGHHSPPKTKQPSSLPGCASCSKHLFRTRLSYWQKNNIAMVDCRPDTVSPSAMSSYVVSDANSIILSLQ